MNREWIRSKARQAGDTLAELVYPSDIYCIGCGRPIAPSGLYALCEECILQLRWANGAVCQVCGKALEDWYPDAVCAECKNRERSFSGGVTCFVYQGPARTMIKHLKYGNSGYVARFLGEALADSIRARGLAFDWLIPVPMYYKKVRARGYNQAALIARFAAERLGCGWREDLLVRTRPTAPMSRLKGAERRRNLEGAFAVPATGREILRDSAVVVVDDIYTTGTTMDCCARVLLEAGAAAVSVASIAAGYNQRILPEIAVRKGNSDPADGKRPLQGKNMI